MLGKQKQNRIVIDWWLLILEIELSKNGIYT